MKIEPAIGQTWRNKRNGTVITVTGVRPHSSGRGDWDKSIEFVTHRGHDGESFYPNFHGRFEIVEVEGVLPVDAALTKPLDDWPTDFLVRLMDAAAEVVEGRDV